jgi:nitrate/nitrite transporter NarK
MGKELAFAAASCSSAGRLGTSLNLNIVPSILGAVHSLAYLFWIMFFFVCLCLLFALIAVLADQKARRESGFSKEVNKKEKIQCKDLKNFEYPVWLILVIKYSFYGTFYGFSNIAVKFLMDRFGYSKVYSGNLAVSKIFTLISLVFVEFDWSYCRTVHGNNN